MDIILFLEQINPNMWAFLGVLTTAGLAYFSARGKRKQEGAITLAETSMLLLEQYRIAHEECQEQLVKLKSKSKKKVRKKRKGK